MAAAKPAKLNPEAPEQSGGPVIEYQSEAAKAVKFTINPLASKYVVRDDGQVAEYL